MSEAEWQVSEKPWEMLTFVLRKRGRVSQRQPRLYAVACVRRVWSVLDHDGSRGAVTVAEKYADGTATLQELDRAWGAAEAAWLKHDRAGNYAAIQAAVAAKEACRSAAH